ncbi:MAG: SDR family NAD(P)-dependent oxidoreductase [Kofleriaceae bacterium]
MAVPLTRVIVVGASSGIGAELARQLAAAGATVAILARREAELAAVAAADPARLRPYVHDVTDAASVPALLARIEADLGGVDALVYAAGVMPELAEGEYDFGKDAAMVQVNLLGAMAWMDPVCARFEAARAGTIVGISSIAGVRGRRGNPGYTATKAALSTYLEALRNRATRYGVNVVTIKPGFVDTAMTAGKPGLFWLVSAAEAARQILALARRGGSPDAFVPARWAAVAAVVRLLPSTIFRRLNL